jgi:hypothetical protein
MLKTGPQQCESCYFKGRHKCLREGNYDTLEKTCISYYLIKVLGQAATNMFEYGTPSALHQRNRVPGNEPFIKWPTQVDPIFDESRGPYDPKRVFEARFKVVNGETILDYYFREPDLEA